MLLHSPLLSRPFLGSPNTTLGYVAIVGQAVVVAPLSDPLVDIVSSVSVAPFGELVVAVEIETASGMLYAATHPIMTLASENPASTPFPDRLDPSLVITRELSAGTGYGGYSQNVSELALINADGFYDSYVDGNSVNGRTITIKVGAKIAGVIAPYAQFEKMAVLIGERWLAKRDRVRIENADALVKFQVPAQPNVYLGTGGLEGDSLIAGKRKPRGHGYNFNATPTLVVGAEGLFQFHDGQNEVASIGAVKDGGIPLNFFADYATSALLRAALTTVPSPIVPGAYGTCKAEGLFGIGGIAFKQVTVDFTMVLTTTADIIRDLAVNVAGFDPAEIDEFTFEELDAAQTAVRSFYLGSDSNMTCAELMSKLMNGIGGWWGLTTLGRLRVRRVEPPTMIPSAVYDLDGGNLVDVDAEQIPTSVDPPPWRRRVTWAHNWTQQTDLYGQVSEGDPALADYLGKPYKIASTIEGNAAATLALFPLAPDPDPTEGFLAAEAPAIAESERVRALYGSGRDAFTAELKNALCVHQIGETIQLVDTTISPRLGLATARNVIIVRSRDTVATLETELGVFG